MADALIKHQILIDDCEEQEGFLFAIYSSVEIFRLVYHINKELGISLARKADDLEFLIAQTQAYYMLYHHFDEKNDYNYYLINNKTQVEEKDYKSNGFLFEEHSFFNTYLIPERKSVDYFLKIEGMENAAKLMNKLRNLNQISSVYIEHIHHLKSHRNLIFD